MRTGCLEGHFGARCARAGRAVSGESCGKHKIRSDWGSGGRRFKSCRPDRHKKAVGRRKLQVSGLLADGTSDAPEGRSYTVWDHFGTTGHFGGRFAAYGHPAEARSRSLCVMNAGGWRSIPANISTSSSHFRSITLRKRATSSMPCGQRDRVRLGKSSLHFTPRIGTR